MRIDKWLWCVRLYKTRTLAAEACNSGKVSLNNASTKPSKEINLGDTIVVNMNTFKKTVKVVGLLNNRVPAKDVPKYYEDLTPKQEYEKQEMMRIMYYERRDAHIGRPTKKDRRNIDKFKEDNFS
ncbi:MAG: RNA-binding S4 domain-containing protein [Bacteroidales bacterium]|nr:RNA-binding S4 domain-containing protein [Bacteroidales bacterium]